MDIWYTPERIAQQQEIEKRRLARYRRRAARKARQERRERVIEAFKNAFEYLLFGVLFYAYMYFGCLWASM